MSKRYLLFYFLSLAFFSRAQTVQQRVNILQIDKDSVAFPLDHEYHLTGDSCTEIVRYCRYDFEKKIFHGKFTDVNKANANQIVSEGYYSAEGLKDGLFKINYLNGQLMAKGTFKDGKFDGKWDIYYSDGKPQMSFEVTDGQYTIKEMYKPDGTKSINGGTGLYIGGEIVGAAHWVGKLLNGKPNGKWHFYLIDGNSDAPLSTENYNKGVFEGGNTGDFNYTEKSHIIWISNEMLPLLNGDNLTFANTPCNGVKPKNMVDAHYGEGLNAFSVLISDAVEPYLKSININGINSTIRIAGEINEKGEIVKLKNSNSNNESICRGLILSLRSLPPLLPATIDGKPVTEQFFISFEMYRNTYRFSYQFVPVKIEK